MFLEGCGAAGNNALAVAVRVNDQWIVVRSRRDGYRIARDGCFRAAIPLPAPAGARDVSAVRVQAFPRKDQPANTSSRFTRLNTMFSLNERFVPEPRIIRWEGDAMLRPGGPPFEIPVK